MQKRSPLALRMVKRCLNAELDGQHGSNAIGWRRDLDVLFDGRSPRRKTRLFGETRSQLQAIS